MKDISGIATNVSGLVLGVSHEHRFMAVFSNLFSY